MNDFLVVVISTIILVAITVATFFGTVFLRGFQGYGTGQYVGYVTGVEARGTIFKTSRVYMKTSLDSSLEDAFCVTDEELYNSLKEKQLSQERIAVNTEDLGSTFPAECDGEETSISSIK